MDFYFWISLNQNSERLPCKSKVFEWASKSIKVSLGVYARWRTEKNRKRKVKAIRRRREKAALRCEFCWRGRRGRWAWWRCCHWGWANCWAGEIKFLEFKKDDSNSRRNAFRENRILLCLNNQSINCLLRMQTSIWLAATFTRHKKLTTKLFFGVLKL